MLLGFAVKANSQADSAKVWVIPVVGVIGPATADYLHRAFEKANMEERPVLIVLAMDTPGGLDSSMRAIIKDITDSPIPVASFVTPPGARAASAGTYILYASHIAAMAPGTNLGAATPIQLGGMPGVPSPKEGATQKKDENAEALHQKRVNDASAYLRALAQMRGRNPEWADAAVREAASLSATEALDHNVIDVVADNIDDLLDKLDGKQVMMPDGKQTLTTKKAKINMLATDWRYEFLSTITNPNVAYILMLIGVYGLIFELSNPGFILPGVAGVICIVLALYAFQVLPVNYSGLALILLGIAFMAAELFVPSFGALGVGGLIAFVIGSVILMETDIEGYTIYWPVIASVAISTAVFILAIMGMAMRAHNRPIVSGREEMIGMKGRVESSTESRYIIRVHGELWQARSQIALVPGQPVTISGLDNLVLDVEPTEFTNGEKGI